MFVGQNHIVNDLRLYLPEVLKGNITHFLLKAPSGYGKTTLALKACNYLTGNGMVKKYAYYIPDSGSISLRNDCFVHFIDEVHLLDKPEVLYPAMDKRDSVFILATNESANLKEPLVNRCVSLVFSPYTDDELLLMVKSLLSVNITEQQARQLIAIAGGNPRLIKQYCNRLTMYFRGIGGSFDSFVATYLGVKDNLDVQSQRYVEALQRLGGRASLKTISSMLHIDEDTLRYQVEPVLLYQGRLTISSKGRILNDKN